jgi:hypothetical protein
MVHTVKPDEIIARCKAIAELSEQPGCTTRTFLSQPMREVHRILRLWMESLGMSVSVDAAGNLRGYYAGIHPNAPRLLIGSHLDTVPCAGAFDGVLGVVLAIGVVESLNGRRVCGLACRSSEAGLSWGVWTPHYYRRKTLRAARWLRQFETLVWIHPGYLRQS